MSNFLFWIQSSNEMSIQATSDLGVVKDGSHQCLDEHYIVESFQVH